MRLLFLAALFLSLPAMAQTPTTTTTAIPAKGISTTTAAPAAAAPPPNPWKISYFGEFQGPQLSNFDIQKTVWDIPEQSYAEWDHYLKVGYGVSKSVTLGTQIRAFNSFDPKSSFGFYDMRFYAQWNHFIETSDVDIMGKFVLELPTTDASRNAGKIMVLKFATNVELKTQLRNWSFSFATLIQPQFFNDPVTTNKTDMVVGLYPYITMDMSPNVQLLFEASFETIHKYAESFYDFASGTSDYVDIGPLFTINSHVNTNVALRFLTDDISFKASELYVNIGIAL